MIELVQAGILDMAKVSVNTLGQFDERYAIFSLPYLFVGQDHYYWCHRQPGHRQDGLHRGGSAHSQGLYLQGRYQTLYDDIQNYVQEG